MLDDTLRFACACMFRVSHTHDMIGDWAGYRTTFLRTDTSLVITRTLDVFLVVEHLISSQTNFGDYCREG